MDEGRAVYFGGNQDVTGITDEVQKIARRITKNIGKSKKALDLWDHKALNTSLTLASQDIKRLTTSWEETKQGVCKAVEERKSYLQSDAYQNEIEKVLKEVGLTLQGTYPDYTILPFKLNIDQENQEVKFVFGRKVEKTGTLHPQQVALWVEKRRKMVLEKKFNFERFCRELLEAYKFANKAIFKGGDVLWNKAVSLKTIYEILTVRASAKKEYPKELYAYDLGRLKEQFEIRYKNYLFDFGFTRDQGQGFLIVDNKGRESHVSTLNIYREDE